MTGPAGLGEGAPDPEDASEEASAQPGSPVEQPSTAEQDAREQVAGGSSETPGEVLADARDEGPSGP